MDKLAFPLLENPWPFYSADEINAVQEVLASGKVNYWTGTQGMHFEKEFSAYCSTEYSIALMNGSVALEAALYALDINTNDEVITTSRSFIASASAAVLRGIHVKFADVDLQSQNITAETIEPLIGPKTKAIIVVHLAGWPCEMDAILQLAHMHGLFVIEDCSQAHGAMYGNKPVGSMGDIGTFSFCQDKIISTGGEGGMITTNSHKLWEKIWAYKDHGRSYNQVFNKEHPIGFRWLIESFGTNWRMTEIQAAIGRLQLKKLNTWIEIRQRNASLFNKIFSKLAGVRVTQPPNHIKHAYYKYYFFVNPINLTKGWNRDRLLQELTDVGIQIYSGSCSEMYLEKAFDNTEMRPHFRLANAKLLGETSLQLQVHPTLNSEQITHVGNTIATIIDDITC